MGATTTDAVATVQRFMDLNMAGDLEAGSQLMSEDVAVHEAPGLPYGGEYRGRAEFLELLGKIGANYELVPVEVLGVRDAGDDLVVVTSHLRFTGRASGRSAETHVCELFRIRDGQITDLDIFYKDPGAVAGLL
jgi:ketosteroid isomerase-like protein